MLLDHLSQGRGAKHREANLHGHCSAVIATQRRRDLEEGCGVSLGDRVAIELLARSQ